MRDLQMSFVRGADGKHTVALTAVFDYPDEAIVFNRELVDICRKTLEGMRSQCDPVRDMLAAHGDQ